MQLKSETKDNIGKNKVEEIVDTALKGIGLAMGIAVTVLSVLGELDTNSAFVMLGIGLASISISSLKDNQAGKFFISITFILCRMKVNHPVTRLSSSSGAIIRSS